MATNARVKELAELAREQGWRVDFNGGHFKFYLPPGRTLPDGSTIATLAGTPSSEATVTASANELAKAGLIINKKEWTREKRRRRNGSHVTKLPKLSLRTKGVRDLHAMEAFVTATDHQLLVAAKATHEGQAASEVGDNTKLAFIMSIMKTWPEWYDKCVCGKQFSSPIALLRHTMMPKLGAESFQTGDTAAVLSDGAHQPLVDATVMPCEVYPDFKPSAVHSIRCPVDDCSVWVFDTQAFLLQEHLVQRHGLQLCGLGCGRVLNENVAPVHNACCFKNPHAEVNRVEWEGYHELIPEVIERLADEGKPTPWERMMVKGFDEEITCIVQGPERGTPYVAMPCAALCGAPVGRGRAHSALCERCDAAVDAAVERHRAEAETARTLGHAAVENAAESPEKITELLHELMDRVIAAELMAQKARRRTEYLERVTGVTFS
jgi:hypothetical protein